MKNKKKLIIILIVLVVIVIISYGIISFVSDYKNSKKELEQNINVINNEYDNFKEEIDGFSSIRDDIYENILDQIYYETFEKNVLEWNNKFSDYDKIVNDITKYDKLLGEKCLNKTYINTIVNQKCEMFIETYEMLINLFITDINLYNEHIEKYNKWKIENDSSNGSKTIEKFSSKIIEYVDYNNDKKYLGKE